MSTLQSRLAEIRSRLGEATPGPWKTDDGANYIWGPNMEMVAEPRGFGAGLPMDENASVIANAPADLALLLQIVETQADALRRIAERVVPPSREYDGINSNSSLGLSLYADETLTAVEALMAGGGK